jgi:hypothetical protein
MARRRHPNKDIEAALVHAEAHGWRVEMAGGHAWARLYCPWNERECRCGEFCIVSIWSTPRNPVAHARQIHRVVDGCKGGAGSEEEQS